MSESETSFYPENLAIPHSYATEDRSLQLNASGITRSRRILSRECQASPSPQNFLTRKTKLNEKADEFETVKSRMSSNFETEILNKADKPELYSMKREKNRTQ